MRRILITGGAGFVGSTLALHWKQAFPATQVIALDNLKRRGSELALPRLHEGGVTFHHGDVRSPEDLETAGPVDLLVECSAEPSVQAGYNQNPAYLLNTNLLGLVNCLDHLRRTGGDLIFLSSSRVYPIAKLRALPLHPEATRLALAESAHPGWSPSGITESFPLSGARSLYGATKLAAELLIEEYRAMYNLRAIINRCGVLAGPWQMGKVDQGFVALWLARHLYGGNLTYRGFGGHGMQVRDILHVDDLFALLLRQATAMPDLDGATFNVGGGPDRSLSLRELTHHCAALTGTHLQIGSDPETHQSDIPWYITDTTAVRQATNWQPTRDLATILTDVHRWLLAERPRLEPILGT
jgi:CDP-paratose 2-epimerase